MRKNDARSPLHPKVPQSLPRRHALAAVAASLFALPVVPAMAATINVLSTDPVNATVCTLSDAIRAANTDAIAGGCSAGSGADTIVLPANSTFSFIEPQGNVVTALPLISTEIVIQGNGATIRRDAAATSEFRILGVVPGAKFELQDSTLSGGVAGSTFGPLGGGGINNNGNTRLIRCHVTGNRAAGDGGGILNGTNLYSGELTLVASTVSGNSSGTDGGGISQFGPGTVTLRNSTISGNSAAESGGGLYDSSGANFFIYDSTVTGNTSDSIGGGIYFFSTNAAITRSVVSGNTAPGAKEFLAINSGLSLIQNLFGHSGLSNAEAFSTGLVFGATDITATSNGTLPTALADILDTTLADNGGPTPTHALVAGSPAVDASGACAATTPTDQRGVSRPQGAACDIGAFELEPSVALTYTLTVARAGTGTGTVNSSPAGIACGADCTENYAENLIINLTALPASGSIFSGWSGACTGTSTCAVTMSQARSVTATFATASSDVCATALPTRTCTVNGKAGQLCRVSSGANTLIGSSGNDVMIGGTGNDSLRGAGGNDLICGRGGNDSLLGEAGNDKLYGGDGTDTLDGGDGDDLMSGGNHNDTLRGRNGKDLLYGDWGDDTIYGGANDDRLYGWMGNDKLYGEDGNDRLQGDDGNDLLNGGNGTDTAIGGNGTDSCSAESKSGC